MWNVTLVKIRYPHKQSNLKNCTFSYTAFLKAIFPLFSLYCILYAYSLFLPDYQIQYSTYCSFLWKAASKLHRLIPQKGFYVSVKVYKCWMVKEPHTVWWYVKKIRVCMSKKFRSQCQLTKDNFLRYTWKIVFMRHQAAVTFNLQNLLILESVQILVQRLREIPECFWGITFTKMALYKAAVRFELKIKILMLN